MTTTFRPKLIAAAALLVALPAFAQTTFSVGNELPSATEQTSQNLINRFRADPQGELSRMLGTSQSALYSGVTLSSTGTASDGTAWSNGFWQARAAAGNSAASAMDYFHVNPGDLLKQWSLLPAAGTLAPYAWNTNLGSSAQQYANLVVSDAGATSNPHTVAPYSTFSFQRYTDAGYTNGSTVGENIARNFPANTDYTHAGFAVDWGNTTNGIQTGAGHRSNMLSTSFTEFGIGIADSYTAGQLTQVQHFGDRFNSASEYLWGYTWQDATGGSYTYGEGTQGLSVNVLDGSGNVVGTTTTDANGGYTLQVANLASGNYTVQFSNGSTVVSTQSVTIGSSGLYNANLVTTPVPEPETWLMFAAGLVPMLLRRRTQARHA